MREVLIFTFVIGALVLVVGFEFGRTVVIDDDGISVSVFGRTRHLALDQIDKALVQLDAFGSTVVVVTARSTRGSIVIPVTSRERNDGRFSRLVELLRRAAERGARVEPELFDL